MYRSLSHGAPLIAFHFRELNAARFTAQLRLLQRVAVGVADRDRAVVAAQRQQVLLAPTAADDLLRVFAEDWHFTERCT